MCSVLLRCHYVQAFSADRSIKQRHTHITTNITISVYLKWVTVQFNPLRHFLASPVSILTDTFSNNSEKFDFQHPPHIYLSAQCYQHISHANCLFHLHSALLMQVDRTPFSPRPRHGRPVGRPVGGPADIWIPYNHWFQFTSNTLNWKEEHTEHWATLYKCCV